MKMKVLSPPELVDHCTVRNVEPAANLLKKYIMSSHSLYSKIVLELPRECGGCPLDICTSGGSPKHQEHPGRETSSRCVSKHGWYMLSVSTLMW